MQNDEQKLSEETRLKKLNKEMGKMKLRHSNEEENLKLRLNQKFTEFKRKRAIDFELLLQISRNKQESLQKEQKKQLNCFKHPNTARVQNLANDLRKTLGITVKMGGTMSSNQYIY